MSKIATMMAVELVRDWDLWPRFDAAGLDGTNVRQMKEFLRAGGSLPAIIVDRISKRLIDGFHRVAALMAVYGDTVEVEVELRDYKNEKEMFVDAIRLNVSQGLKLSQKDKAHAIVKGLKKKISNKALALVLGMRPEVYADFKKKRTATTEDNETLALSHGASELAGKMLTKAQEKYARSASGILPIVHGRILLNALRANCMPLSEEDVVILGELRDAIDVALTRRSY